MGETIHKRLWTNKDYHLLWVTDYTGISHSDLDPQKSPGVRYDNGNALPDVRRRKY